MWIWFSGLMSLILAGIWTPSVAQSTRYDLNVTALALGARVFAIDVSASVDERSYLVEASMKTAGVVDALAAGEGLFRAMGSVGPNGLEPERFLVRTVGRSGERHAELAWDNFGLALVNVDPPPEVDNRDVVPPDLLRGTKDLVSSILGKLVLRNGVDPCTGSLRVFDGRRRYDLHLHWGPDDEIKPHRYSGYSGPARRCLVHHQLIAGYNRDYADKIKERPPTVYTVWVIPTPDGRILLPVKFRSETWFGGVTAYVGTARANGQLFLGEAAAPTK